MIPLMKIKFKESGLISNFPNRALFDFSSKFHIFLFLEIFVCMLINLQPFLKSKTKYIQ